MAETKVTDNELADNISGAWTPWSPTFIMNGASNGSGNVDGGYRKVGKTVDFWAQFTITGTTNFAGLTYVDLVLPYPASADFNNNVYIPVGNVLCLNAGNWVVPGVNFAVGNNRVRVHANTFNGSNSTINSTDISQQQPFSWGLDDRIHLSGRYEAE